MRENISPKAEKLFWDLFHTICKESRFLESKNFIQHGNTSVYQHSLSVAYCSCVLATRLHLPVNWHDLIRGALLHDYFLYDWHDKTSHHLKPHGFYHPGVALKNASEDFTLSNCEKNIIKRHMFPLTPIPPSYLEGWIVCLADKYVSTAETLQKNCKPFITPPEYEKQSA